MESSLSRTNLLREIRKMRFEEAYEGWRDRRLTQEEAAQMPEDAPHHRRVADQRDQAHWTVTFWTHERIGFVDFADDPRAHVACEDDL